MSVTYHRSPCPGRIFEDLGVGFSLGWFGGSLVYFFKGNKSHKIQRFWCKLSFRNKNIHFDDSFMQEAAGACLLINILQFIKSNKWKIWMYHYFKFMNVSRFGSQYYLYHLGFILALGSWKKCNKLSLVKKFIV